jgi:predicted nucleic acid-binding Zn ribbon protein
VGSKKTRTCPYCLEEIGSGASRCKHCGAVLPVAPRKRKRNLLALFFFLTTVLLGILCWYQQGKIERQQNYIDRIERQMGNGDPSESHYFEESERAEGLDEP